MVAIQISNHTYPQQVPSIKVTMQSLIKIKQYNSLQCFNSQMTDRRKLCLLNARIFIYENNIDLDPTAPGERSD